MPEMIRDPRSSFGAASEVCPIDKAIGRVGAEMVIPYPPGVPLLVPGEKITADVVAAVRQLHSAVDVASSVRRTTRS